MLLVCSIFEAHLHQGEEDLGWTGLSRKAHRRVFPDAVPFLYLKQIQLGLILRRRILTSIYTISPEKFQLMLLLDHCAAAADILSIVCCDMKIIEIPQPVWASTFYYDKSSPLMCRTFDYLRAVQIKFYFTLEENYRARTSR